MIDLSSRVPVPDVPPDLSLQQLLAARAAERADVAAILAPGRLSLSYGRLRAHVEETIRTFRSCGIDKEDRVAVVLPQGPEAITAILAVTAGAICLPLNPSYRAAEFHGFFSRLRARALVIQAGLDSPARAEGEAQGLRVLELIPRPEAASGLFDLAGAGPAAATRCEYPAAGDIAFVLHTSGTTSQPKIVPLTQRHLLASAHQALRVKELTERDRCLNLVPHFHVYALISVLSLLLAGASFVSATHFTATEFFDWLEEFRPTSYTGVPAMHQAILAAAASRAKPLPPPCLRYIPSSGAPLSPQTREQLERLFAAPVIESYGMTEAGLITSNPMPPGARPPGSVGRPVGAEIAVIDEAGDRLPHGVDGEVIVRGPSVMGGYENDPSANEQAFVDGWLRTGDLGRWDADGYLYITGRIKEMINRGGEKISPREIDEALLQHPAVAQAVAFAVPDPHLGETVGAAVVLRPGALVTEQEIRQSAADRLADFKVPRQVIFLEELPKGPTGKLQRIGLAEKLGITARAPGRPDGREGPAPPRTALEAELYELWKQALGVPEVGIHDDFLEIGGNSMQAANLMALVEKRYERRLLLASLFQSSTIAQMAEVLSRPDVRAPGSSLVAIQPSGSQPPLFCIHPIGGNVLGYRHVARHLGSDQPVYGLQARGLDGKQLPLDRVETMAACYLQEIRSVQSVGPYSLCGQSFGGYVAYEIAQQLAATGEEVALLALFDSYGPQILWNQTPVRVARRTLAHLQAARRMHSGARLPYLLARARGVRKKLSRRIWQTRYKLYHQRGQHLPDDLREIGMTHFLAISRYLPRPYPGRLTLFSAAEQSIAAFNDRAIGWNGMAAGGIEVHVTPGNHNSILEEPQVREVAEILGSLLGRRGSAAGCSLPR